MVRFLYRRRPLLRADRGTDKKNVTGDILRHGRESTDDNRPPVDPLRVGDLLKNAAERIRTQHADYQGRFGVGKQFRWPLHVAAELVKVEYDIEAAVRAVMAPGLPGSVAESLVEGLRTGS